MRPGWYVLNYHNVDWEDSYFTRSIGGVVRPDVFRSQLDQLAGLGRLVSVTEGLERLASGRAFDEPLISLWFDDGFAGVRRYALPLLEERDVAAAMSVCSRFALRKEMFWRAELSYLVHVDGLRFVRSRLRKLRGPVVGLEIRAWTRDSFDLEIRAVIREVYEEHSTPELRRDAFRLFDTPEGLAELGRRGWVMANHSAAHYPASGPGRCAALAAEMRECEPFVRELGGRPDLWVVPFGRKVDEFRASLTEPRTIVDVANRPNDGERFRRDSTIYRLNVPDERDLRPLLRAAARSTDAAPWLPAR